ncbi:hypothetical protein BC939DRAFT_445311 [Gamsiella multidivaricata]|uniref:uncharacterized protein n=1 Tax=Gamsiella multidivaricata TaxID=101098 RepID=UPI00221F54B4|nr:uncharacterized protein BC939DRAFT_445311 [Gamsiella multidivaricata]KAI7827458.1 hypothetical protein BC939DRAFT_445311 [Gamsiella multidivaricata]
MLFVCSFIYSCMLLAPLYSLTRVSASATKEALNLKAGDVYHACTKGESRIDRALLLACTTIRENKKMGQSMSPGSSSFKSKGGA